MKPFSIALFAALTLALPAYAANPVVLELYTSQGCPACPPADALLQELSKAPGVVALSFHVDYWDRPDWKDGFSLPQSTSRQVLYQRILKQDNLFTPELVIDGQRAMIGSNVEDVAVALQVASERPKAFAVSLTPSQDRKQLTIDFAGTKPVDDNVAGVWLITFSPPAVSAVHGGEASGKAMTSVNNVTAINRIAVISDAAPKPITVKMNSDPSLGYAVLVQETAGRVIGVGAYVPTPTGDR